MSSTIKLYEHNQKAYDALLDMLGERDRACVIKPTGTGKFVIIAKMVQDNPDKRFLLLGTNDYMFNDQMANLTEIAPGFTPENLQFMTYSAAMMAARRGEEICSRMENTYREMKGAGEHPAFSPSDFKIVGKALEIKQLTGELRNALNRQVSVDDKITFLEEIAAQNDGKL